MIDYATDVNNDSSINVLDVVMTVNVILSLILYGLYMEIDRT